jgi:translocation and assembly module TamA
MISACRHLTPVILLAFLVSFTPWALGASNLKVTVKGVNNPLLNNIRQSLSIIQKGNSANNSPLGESTITSHHRKAEAQIQKALQPFGYYQPIIKASLVKESEIWQASYEINPGVATYIDKVEVKVTGPGENESTLRKILANPLIKEGDPLKHKNYSQFKQQLFDTLYNLGYLDIKYERSELRVNIDKNVANIILDINTGPKYYFGKVTIEQNHISDKVVNKFITIDDETPFNTNKLLNLQLKLVDSGYFGQIDIDVQRDKTINQRIPVVITAKPSKKLKYSTSIGYGTDTGPRAGISVLNRRVNRRGHRLQYSLRASPVESNLSAKYTIPIGDIHTESWDFSATGNRESINDSESIQYRIGSSLNQNRWGGRRALSLNLIQEDFSFDDEPDQTTVLFIPSLEYTRQKADNRLFTRKGYGLSLNIRGAADSLLSDVSYIHSSLSAKLITPLGSRGRLLNRLEVGAIETDDFNELPPSQRFFTGGSQSVRGYGYKDIGEKNSLGNNIGGRYLLTGSIEIDYLLYGNYGAAVFYDMGDASNTRDFSLKKSAGIGFRYKSPIGMIRVDLAHPFDDPDEDIRLHIRIGPDL